MLQNFSLKLYKKPVPLKKQREEEVQMITRAESLVSNFDPEMFKQKYGENSKENQIVCEEQQEKKLNQNSDTQTSPKNLSLTQKYQLIPQISFNIENNTSKVNLFEKNLEEILLKICLSQSDIQQISVDGLDQVEQMILYSFMLRKMKRKVKPRDLNKNWIQEQKTNELLKSFQCFFSKKRFQENLQFLFKNSMKFLKNKLQTEDKLERDSKIEKVYQYYFQETAEQMNVKVDLFMDPLVKKSDSTINYPFKTFGKEFLFFVLRSKEYKMDFLKFIDDEVKNYYEPKIKIKIKSLLKQLQKKILKLSNDRTKFNEQDLERIKNFLIIQNQSKLPWTMREIDFAVQNISFQLDKAFIVQLMKKQI